LGVSVLSDSLIPNLQERLLQQLALPTARMVALSNCGSFLLVLAFTAVTGELAAAAAFLRPRPGLVLLLLAQGACGYGGLRCYLGIVKNVSGVAAVVATSVRKVLSISLSFVLFAKPFTPAHLAALLLWATGLVANVWERARRQRRASSRRPGGSSTKGGGAEGGVPPAGAGVGETPRGIAEYWSRPHVV
jgi:adenosine 3'-phospho 5'-phosphosulfate transporter B3